MQSVKVTVAEETRASRLELLIRLVWGPVVGFVLGILGTVVAMAVFVQWLHILFLAKRHSGLQRLINAYGAALSQLKFYVLLATDERPAFFPEF